MKTKLTPWIVCAGAMTLAGCADGNLARRNDGRYTAVAPFYSPGGALNTPNDRLPTTTLPASVSKSPVGGDYTSTLMATESPREQKQRETQDQFEADLATLDKK